MSEKDKACREAFEAWAVDESWTVDWAGNDPYDHGRTMDAWEAFQAAWSRRAPEWNDALKAAAKVVMDLPMKEVFGSYPFLTDECKAFAITANSAILNLRIPAAPQPDGREG